MSIIEEAAGGERRLRSATLPQALTPAGGTGLNLVDIDISDGRIAAIAPAGTLPERPGAALHDCDGGLVFPAFIDLHTHLDKGHIWPRKPNPDGSFMSALNAVMADREASWSAADVERRMDFALRCAYAHGTAAIRTHIDSAPPQHEISWPVLGAMRERWAGRIELQGVALLGPDHLLDPGLLERVASTARAAGGRLGGAISVFDRAREAIAAAVEAAGRHGLDLDLHIDESEETASRSLAILAETVIETGFSGKVVAGHCCSLAVHDETFARETIERVAEAGIAIVSLPMCNLYLQDRHGENGPRTPRWRGVTLVNELRAAGVAVSLASDNTRDPFYAYGDLDGLEVLREAARIAHLDHPADEAFSWARAVTSTPSEVGEFSWRGEIAVGAPADCILFRARSWTELMARPQSDRIVLRAGRPIDRTLPDYRELDNLMGAPQP
ncbi:cytosine deaminase [Jiella endophytica]|uniref:Cytosine deaminase n=1 Tax=Jiella endophytica TaxID=2558362 RepID=A0A4Y8RM74_9HYPH|nr:cytosine deaminase [Jiella endophytica]TFF23223.1 cytosine deaminase [Jiella endophytica]